ncbi:DUF4302 domain-containing protein [Chondrinema litorale]|uniref:DUF4302 domain-containing protein n=1 Tax=Chondrinema litorale TaxID=2994555 RepID=UPI002543B6AF|nr:DUF4302 domain-containing protein [Chondrinema litorale]UZR95517.1 DUF4302 domain-containing protein [Chondrinema litorale]
MLKKYIYPLLFLAFISACDDDEPETLASVEVRSAEAIQALETELTTPSNGWILQYTPTDGAGFFNVLLNFDAEGKVNIKTDAMFSDGEYFDQTISYRIDNAQGLELILETYGFFHYLFEKDQSTFGGEFEFLYDSKDGENLIFGSLSDASDRTVLVFKPATDDDITAIENSRDLAELLEASIDGTGSSLVESVSFQVILESQNVSVFFVFDFDTRSLKVLSASEGVTEDEILASSNNILVNHTTGYGYSDGSILLEEPVAFTLGGQQVIISSIALTSVSQESVAYCDGEEASEIYSYKGTVLGSGNVTAKTGLFMGSTNFQPMLDNPFSTDIAYFYNENSESIGDSILADIPDAYAFQLYYGYDIGDTDLFYAMGIVLLDADNNVDFLLREFEPIENEGNKLTFNFTGEYFTTKDMTAEQEAAINKYTDLIFGGTSIYVIDLAFRDDLFILYNPCNKYETLMFN